MEIIVVDNGSNDGTPAAADDFPGVTMLRLPKNFGRTKALNIGIRTAKGDFIYIMNPNIEVQPDTIARLLARIADDESVGAVCPYSESVYTLPNPDALKTAWRSGQLARAQAIDTAAQEVDVDYPMGSPMLVRRSFLKGMNYFDERLGEHWADLELCWQLRSAGKKNLVLPAVRVSRTAQPKTVFSDVIESADSAAGAAAYISKHYGFGAGLGFRLRAMLGALGAFDMKLLSALISGRKIDGTQP
jgi:GT2 family glycosyltransferase